MSPAKHMIPVRQVLSRDVPSGQDIVGTLNVDSNYHVQC